MPGVVLVYSQAGSVATQRVTIEEDSLVSSLASKAAGILKTPDSSNLVLSYQGNILAPESSMKQVGAGGVVRVTLVQPPTQMSSPKPVTMAKEEINTFTIAFGSAFKNPAFSRVVKRLQQRENMESLAAACPGLATDLVAQGFLTRPELLLHLLDPETLAKVGASHPSILEAAHNLAAAVHEEQASGGKDQEQAGSSGGSYYLDEMSDEEMDVEEAAQAGGSNNGAGSRARSSNSFNAITPAQLAQALSAAAGGGGSSMAGFQGVTGLGPRGPSNPPATTPGLPSPNPRITTNMFQDALMQALSGMGGGQQQQQPTQQATEGDYSVQVERMREMGIVDEGLALRALQIMGGDLQAAVDLIFSGWDGADEAMQ